MVYDIYLTYRCDSKYDSVMSRIRNRLLSTGLKVAWMSNADLNVDMRSDFISKSKIIVLCLDESYQMDQRCLCELRSNRLQRVARLVIPILLEPPTSTFPSEEFKVHSQLSLSGTKVFDLSTVTMTSTVYPTPTAGVDPLDLEVDKLSEYIHQRINY
jgi:hypothetical protein